MIQKYALEFKIIILLILGLILKGLYIGETNLGLDECFSVYVSQLSPSEIITYLSHGDNPPLWELVLNLWVNFFGHSELSVRIPSLIFNIATIIPIALIGEKYIGKHVGTSAALLFIFSNFSLFIAHEARVYSLLGLLTTTSIYLFLSALNSTKTIKYLLILTVVNTLIVYSHYLGIWIIIMQFLLFICFKDIRHHLRQQYWIHLIGVFSLVSPLLTTLIQRFQESGLSGTWIPTVNGFEPLYNMIWTFSNKPLPTVIFIVILIAAFIKYMIKLPKAKNRYHFLILLFFFVPFILSFALSFKIGLFLDRYFYFLLPLFMLVIMTATKYMTHSLPKQNLFLLLPVILLATTFSTKSGQFKFSGYHTDVKSVVGEIKILTKNPDNAILVCPSFYDKQIVYYLDNSLFSNYIEDYNALSVFYKPLNELNIFPIMHASEINFESQPKRIILIDHQADFNAPNHQIRLYLKENYSENYSYEVGGDVFSIYDLNQ